MESSREGTATNLSEKTPIASITKASASPLFIDRLAASGFEPLVTLANTLRSWAEPIACMWNFTKNNGITEGFHRKIKPIQRRASGFRSFHKLLAYY